MQTEVRNTSSVVAHGLYLLFDVNDSNHANFKRLTVICYQIETDRENINITMKSHVFFRLTY